MNFHLVTFLLYPTKGLTQPLHLNCHRPQTCHQHLPHDRRLSTTAYLPYPTLEETVFTDFTKIHPEK